MGNPAYQLHDHFSAREASFTKIGIDFANLFEKRGWYLYKADEPVRGLEALKNLIEQGRAYPAMKHQRYILLPATGNPSNPNQILYLMQTGSVRYPFYVDVEENEKDGAPIVKSTGVFLIDSVMFTDDLVYLQIDVNAMLYLGMWIAEQIIGMDNPCVTFDLLDMYNKISQITKSYRQKSSEEE